MNFLSIFETRHRNLIVVLKKSVLRWAFLVLKSIWGGALLHVGQAGDVAQAGVVEGVGLVAVHLETLGGLVPLQSACVVGHLQLGKGGGVPGGGVQSGVVQGGGAQGGGHGLDGRGGDGGLVHRV